MRLEEKKSTENTTPNTIEAIMTTCKLRRAEKDFRIVFIRFISCSGC